MITCQNPGAMQTKTKDDIKRCLDFSVYVRCMPVNPVLSSGLLFSISFHASIGLCAGQLVHHPILAVVFGEFAEDVSINSRFIKKYHEEVQ